ncbi:hypothetical protein Dimus_012673 [Dionaea muscipula]
MGEEQRFKLLLGNATPRVNPLKETQFPQFPRYPPPLPSQAAINPSPFVQNINHHFPVVSFIDQPNPTKPISPPTKPFFTAFSLSLSLFQVHHQWYDFSFTH